MSVKHRPNGGTAIDRTANIIGRDLRLDAETDHLTCTWHLSRGFNSGVSVWRAGVAGFSEASSTTVAGQAGPIAAVAGWPGALLL